MEHDDWGPVYITEGYHKGRIGYFDDYESLFSDNESLDPDFFECKSWRKATDRDDENEDVEVLDAAIVYFGNFFLAKGCYVIPFEWIRPVTTQDLMKRRDDLHNLIGRFAIITNPGLKLDPEEEDDFLRELHYVDSTLVDRMIEARYSKTGNGANIFISHSSEDKPFARWLASDLKAVGHKPWLDEWQIRVGESIPKKISMGLKDANFVLVILSENSVKSNWVEREWQNIYWNEVQSGTTMVLPILYSDCEVPELLKTKKYADFRSNYNDGLEDVLLAIHHFTSGDDASQ